MQRYMLWLLLLNVQLALYCMDRSNGVVKKIETNEYIRYQFFTDNGDFLMVTQRFNQEGGSVVTGVGSSWGGVISLPNPQFYFDYLKAKYDEQQDSK